MNLRLGFIAFILSALAVFGSDATVLAQITGPLKSGPGFKIVGTVGNGSVATPYTGPCDVASASCALFYGNRAATGAIAAAATQLLFNLRRASDSQTCDFIVTTSGGIGNAANCSGSAGGSSVTAFCTSTTCSYTKFYNQITATTCSSSNCDIAQSTAASQPVFTANCLGTFPCATAGNGAGQSMTSANSFTITSNPSLAGAWNYSANNSSIDMLNPANGTSLDLNGYCHCEHAELCWFFHDPEFYSINRHMACH